MKEYNRFEEGAADGKTSTAVSAPVARIIKIPYICIMETRKHLAAEKKRCNSHNCAQAVVCTYCDIVGLPEDVAMDIAGAYGTGMGNMEGTCGALVGAGMIVGLATKDRNLSRSRMKRIMTDFQQRNGATRCSLLKGVGTGKVLRECCDCVADASEFLENVLTQE